MLKQAVYIVTTVRWGGAKGRSLPTYGIHVPEMFHQVAHAIPIARSKELGVNADEALA
jgi:hypothetical protein